MPKIKETAVCSEADVDAVWQVLFFASRSMMLKKMENNVEARMQPCLTPLEMGKLPDRDLLHFTITKSNDRWARKPSKCVKTAGYVCRRPLCPSPYKKISFISPILPLPGHSHVYTCTWKTELEVSLYTLGQARTFWKRLCSTGERRIPKDTHGLSNKIWLPMYVSCFFYRITGTAKPLLQRSWERGRGGGSQNPVMKTQNNTLRKLQACTSLLQSSVSNTSVSLSLEIMLYIIYFCFGISIVSCLSVNQQSKHSEIVYLSVKRCVRLTCFSLWW